MNKSDDLHYDATAPALTPETTLLSIDVESNGLHGKAFAVGAVLMKLDGTIVDEFSARCPIGGEVDAWVRKNVMPALKDFPETHKTAKAMRNDFWDWYKQAREKADYLVLSNGYPVEARFMLSLQDDNLEERYWDHFFPILDVASLLLQVGIKPLAIRKRLVADELKGSADLQHNPRWDAWVAALTAIKAFKLSGQLK